MNKVKSTQRKPTKTHLTHRAGEALYERLKDELETASQEVDYLDDACEELRKHVLLDISPVHRFRTRALERRKDLQQRLENVEWLQEHLSSTLAS